MFSPFLLAHNSRKLRRPADAARIVVIERNEVAALIVHRLLGIVAGDIKRVVRRRVALGARNLGLEELLLALTVNAGIVLPALGGEVVQIVLHVLVVLLRHVILDIGVRVRVEAKAGGHRSERREVLLGQERLRRPRPLGVDTPNRGRRLANLIPGVLKLRSHIGHPVERRGGANLNAHRRRGLRSGAVVLLPLVVAPNAIDHHLAGLLALAGRAGPLDGKLALGVDLLKIDDEAGTRLAPNLLELPEGLGVLGLAERLLLESESDGNGSHNSLDRSRVCVCCVCCAVACVYVSNQ